MESAIDTISLKSAGCENDFDARASSMMRITPKQVGLSVTNIDETTPSGLLFKVFPNPVKDKLHIVANNSNIDFIIIKDVFGRLCYHEFISGKFDLEYQKEISIKNMTAGIYFITLSTGSRTQTLKLIVE
ncbi:MAG: T9SS type A sorting domain-containing protein [Saprospiraceae bacterium]|nr:T9SS type A sorting domain-containing protein [Saprospiraceae bacterium]